MPISYANRLTNHDVQPKQIRLTFFHLQNRYQNQPETTLLLDHRGALDLIQEDEIGEEAPLTERVKNDQEVAISIPRPVAD